MPKIEVVLLDLDGTILDEDLANKSAYLTAAELAHQKYGLNSELLAGEAHQLIKSLWKNSFGFPYGEAIGLGSTDGVSSEFSVPSQLIDINKLNNLGSIIRYRAWLEALRGSECDDKVLAEEIAINFSDFRRQSFKPYPGALEALAELERHFLLAIVTNGVKNVQMGKIEACGLNQYTDVFVISEQVQRRKPAAAMFGAAIRNFSIPNHRVAMVGDSLINDIEGSQRAYIGRSIWIRDPNITDMNGIMPDLRIDSLAELPSRLLGLEA